MTTTEIISILLLLACDFILFCVGFKTNILRTNGADSPYSFSKFQLWLWTIIVITAFILNWAYVNFEHPFINETSLVLLGIAAATTTTASVIQSVQIENRARLIALNRTTELESLKAFIGTTTFWSDILKDDNENLSLSRLQNLIFTFIFVIVYVSIFFSSGKQYPDFERETYILMGISSGGYLIAKGNHA